jgi:Adenylate and Guanylate cyclase catalytic domain
MARFAIDCRERMMELMKKLEVTLGPDCSELSMRIGMHSGPVTAGVLRGDRARFQLFGDTVNTASRMESTGAAGKIQLSPETAKLLIREGKGNWVTEREGAVEVKGKGSLKTFWLMNSETSSDSNSDTASSSDGKAFLATERRDCFLDEDLVKRNRLVDWMVEMLSHYVRKMVRLEGIPIYLQQMYRMFLRDFV